MSLSVGMGSVYELKAQSDLLYRKLAENNQTIDFLRQQLAECQAREKVLVEALKLWKLATDNAEECEFDDMASYAIPMPLFCDADEAMESVLAIPSDSTALNEAIKQAKQEALIEAADAEWCDSLHSFELRSMAEELK